MSGTWDASIMLVYIADDERLFPIDIIQNGDAFGVVANIRIGHNLMQFVDSCELFVSVRNLSQSNMLLSRHQSYALAPREAPLNQELQVKLDDEWNANEGDVLEAIVTLKVTAGANHDYSVARSDPLVVASGQARARHV
jgi:hypothetical protein